MTDRASKRPPACKPKRAAPQNIIQDPPFKLDILSCRNLLSCLAADLQKKLIPLFRYALGPGGVLFLGSAETAGAFSERFKPIEARSRLYGKAPVAPEGLAVLFDEVAR